ncbi:MAG: MMPL family transporter [Planctomycetaceae bacterium]|nr:MMPL family transporter [Planctomycetaceae bacterium]
MGTNRTFQSNSNNVADWLPDSFEETNQYQWFLKHFPLERFVVVSWQGCTLDDPQRVLEMFAHKLVPEQAGDRENKPILAEIVGEELPVVEPLDESPPAVQEEPPKYAHYFKAVLTGSQLFERLKEQYSGRGPGGIRLTDEAIHQKLEGILVGPDGESTAMIVTFHEDAPRGKELADVLEAIKDVGRECGVHPQILLDDRLWLARASDAVFKTVSEMIYGRNPNMDGVIMGGPPVDNVAITQEGEQTLQRLIGLCGVIGLTLAWLCFRDIRLTMFVFWLAIISAGVALASVFFTGGTCDAILLTMPALVYVLAMSGAIHMINYYHDAVREHGLDMAPERAVRYAWYPCFAANLTTAFGLISLCMSGLIPISKFGFYSALGIMLQLILLFYYLPTLLHFYPSHKVAAQRTFTIKVDSPMQKVWRVWSGFVIRNAVVISIVSLVLMIIFGFGLTQIKTSVKMMRFFSSDSEIIHHYTWLEERLGPLVPMEIVVTFDNGELNSVPNPEWNDTLKRLWLVEEICNKLQSDLGENIGGVMSAATFMPSSDQIRGIGRMTLTERITRERVANRNFASARNKELREFVTFEGMASFRRNPDQSRDPIQLQHLAQIGITEADADRLVSAGIDDVLKMITIPSDAEQAGISYEEREAFRTKAEAWERNHGIELWRISLRVWSLKKDIDYAHFIQEVKDVVEPIIAVENKGLGLKTSAIEAVYTGMVPVVYKTQHELYNGLVLSFILSFFMIGVAMCIVLRSVVAGFLVMIPNIFPVFVVFGCMGHLGVPVDIGTMMTASVALGIATDDTIHFLTWFRHGIDQGMSRADATRYAYSRSGSAIVQTTLIAGFGLAAFALSTFTPTQMFGIMMLVILLAATLGDLIFLAAVVNTPIGRFFEPKKKRGSLVTEESSVVQPEG